MQCLYGMCLCCCCSLLLKNNAAWAKERAFKKKLLEAKKLEEKMLMEEHNVRPRTCYTVYSIQHTYIMYHTALTDWSID